MTEIVFLSNTDSEADFLSKSDPKKCQSRELSERLSCGGIQISKSRSQMF